MAYGYIQTFLQFPNAKNGSLYIYVANSTEPANVYDPVNANIISQPLSIDSDGYCQQFWVETNNLYDLDVRTFNGQQVETRNNVSVLGGSAGEVGPRGPQGVRGPKGDTGPAGDKGVDGVNGTNGVDGTDGADGVSLVSILVDPESDYGRIIYNKSDNVNTWYEAGKIVPDGVGKVKVSASDAAGFLENKVTSGTNISVVSDSQKLTINNTAPETFKTQASQYSTVKDFLNMIIEGTSGITVSTSADFNKIILSGAGIGGSGFTPRGAWDIAVTYNEGDGVWYYDDTVSPIINRYYVATATTTGVNPFTVGTGWVIMFSIDQLGDQMVKLDATDSTTSFLLDKIKAGDGIVFTRTVDAGGDYITVSGQQVFTVTTTNASRTIDELSHDIKFRGGVWTRPLYVGNEIAIDHLNVIENASNTSVMYTATGLPKFDDYGHYKNECKAIEISDVSGLAGAITAAGDGKVKIDAEDESGPGYLAEKITAGDNIILTRTTGEHGTRIEIKADVNNVNLISSSFDAYASYGSGESDVNFGTFSGTGWVKDGTKIVATTAGKMQVNIAADIYHKASDLVNKFHLWNYTEIETCYRTDITFNSGVGGPDIIEYTVNHSGTYQLDINYDFKANSSGELQLWVCNSNNIYYQHYTFGGGNNGEYPFETQSGSILHTFNAGDKIRINMTVFGDGVSSVDIYGAQVSNITADEHPSYGLRLYHYTNGGIEPAIYNIYDMPNGFAGLKHLQFASILNVSIGDYFKVQAYNPTYGTGEQNIHFNASILQAVVNNVQGATTLDELTDVDVSGAADGQILSYDSSTHTWIPVTGGGGGSDTYTVKVDANDTTPSYLGDKIAAASGSPISVNVVDDTLILDVIESDITDPLIQTIGLMNENGTMGFTGNAYSSVYADGEWATGFGQNTSDAYYRVSTIGRGTINKVKFFVNAYNDVDYGISPTGNYGAIRIGLFDLNGVCKGQTEWTRGLQTLGTVTLTMTPCPGQNLTIDRNGEYWIGIVSRGMQLISYNKAASGFDPMTNALRYSVSIRSSSSGADWSPNFWNTTGGGFIQVKVPCVFMASTD